MQRALTDKHVFYVGAVCSLQVREQRRPEEYELGQQSFENREFRIIL